MAKRYVVEPARCDGCGRCLGVCPHQALSRLGEALCAKCVKYCLSHGGAVLRGRGVHRPRPVRRLRPLRAGLPKASHRPGPVSRERRGARMRGSCLDGTGPGPRRATTSRRRWRWPTASSSSGTVQAGRPDELLHQPSCLSTAEFSTGLATAARTAEGSGTGWSGSEGGAEPRWSSRPRARWWRPSARRPGELSGRVQRCATADSRFCKGLSGQ